jgi:hypothetical protein
MFSAWMKQLAGRVGMQMASNAAPPMFIPDGTRPKKNTRIIRFNRSCFVLRTIEF